ncbi:putative Mir domain superfamily protein [Helianthus anomalus]
MIPKQFTHINLEFDLNPDSLLQKWRLASQIVRPEPDTYVKPGDNIKSGSVIRLQHMRTRKWLHSHLHASPISGRNNM